MEIILKGDCNLKQLRELKKELNKIFLSDFYLELEGVNKNFKATFKE